MSASTPDQYVEVDDVEVQEVQEVQIQPQYQQPQLQQPQLQPQLQPLKTDQDHRCKCEQIVFCCNCEKYEDWCPVNVCQWAGGLYTHCGDGNDDCLATLLCLPIKLPLMLIFCFPCALYNGARNSCNHTDALSYMCINNA